MRNRRITAITFIALFYTLVLASITQAADYKWYPISPLWQSEDFRRAFTGSYGIDSRIEPVINEDETFYLDEAGKQMATFNRPGAIQKLVDSDLLEESAALQFALGNFQFEEQKPKEAIAAFQSALKIFPNYRDAHRNLAMLQVQEGDYENAETHLKRAIELGSMEGLTFGLLAYCHAQNDRMQAALSAYRMARVTMPDELQWKIGEAHALQAIGAADEAISIFTELQTDSPSDPSLWLSLANGYTQKEDDQETLAHLEISKRLGALAPANTMVLGDRYLMVELPDLALENFESAIRSGKVELASATRALENLMIRQNWSQAKAFRDSCIDVYQKPLDDPEKNAEMVSAFQRANALLELEQGDATAGAKLVEDIIARDPSDGDALILLSKFRDRKGQTEEAIVLLEQAAGLPSSRAKALLEHGKLLVSQYRYKEAIKRLEQSYQLKPEAYLIEYIQAVKDLVVD